jgi:uroporphyrinogen-III synthase
VTSEVRAAVFRPDDERIEQAVELLESLGATPVPDPMLAVEPTGETPDSAEWTILTSKTGVELAAEADWSPAETKLACIGSATADAARAEGWAVDLVPEEFSSAGLVEALSETVGEGTSVEVARSDHGSAVLLDGLNETGADVHETVLYRLVRPDDAGVSAERAAAGELEAVLFTSSLTVENFLAAAAERGVRAAAVAEADAAVVGCIGEPTAETAETEGISVDIVPEEATFESLAAEVVELAAPSYAE